MSRTLLPYQRAWVRDASGLKVIEKSRRIGLSWCEAYSAVMHAAGGSGNVYYQSYAKDMTRGFVDDAADWARALSAGASAIGEEFLEEDGRTVQSFRIALSSGKEIAAMTSTPRAFRSRGRPGDVAILDEAAFVDDLDEVLKAALAFRMWGGEVHVMSTHNGDGNPFNRLCREIAEGGRPGSLHTVTFRDALKAGLYRRICHVTEKTWSPEAEAKWEAELRAEYGEDAAEELDCKPSSGAGKWLSWEIIRRAETEDPVPEAAGSLCWIGIDVARRKDLWAAVVLEEVGDVLWTRELIAEQGIPFSEQRRIVRELVERYRPIRIAVDQTGMGEAFVEQLQDDHGSLRVEGVLMTGPRRLDVATALREALEDARLRIPPDPDLRADLRAVEVEQGPTGAPRLIAGRAGTDGHADRFWAYALACAAATDAAGPVAGEVVGERISSRAFETVDDLSAQAGGLVRAGHGVDDPVSSGRFF